MTMYTPPAEEDLNELRGRTAEMVCFAASSIYIHLTDDVLLSLEGAFRHEIQGGDSDAAHAASPLASSRLTRVVGQIISDVQGRSDGTLILHFGNGDILTIDGDNGPYEAYHIRFRDREITI